MPDPVEVEPWFDPDEQEQEAEANNNAQEPHMGVRLQGVGIDWNALNMPEPDFGHPAPQARARPVANMRIEEMRRDMEDRARLSIPTSENPYSSVVDEIYAITETRARRQMEEVLGSMKKKKSSSSSVAVPVSASSSTSTDPVKRVGIAHSAFMDYFEPHFKKFQLLTSPEQVNEVDLVIFSGGADINPGLYNQKDVYCFGVNKKRDDIEVAIFKKAYEANKKILGVCRGHQLIQALLGATLIQDIYTQLPNDGKHPGDHPLQFIDNGVVHKFFGSNNIVNSMHHQAAIMGRAARSLRISSVYGSVIESSENENIITVQFHPEFMMGDRRAISFFKYLESEW